MRIGMSKKNIDNLCSRKGCSNEPDLSAKSQLKIVEGSWKLKIKYNYRASQKKVPFRIS